MYFQLSDPRTPLHPGDQVRTASGVRLIIDRYLACGGSALLYLAHREGTGRYVALKELFPRQMDNLLLRRSGGGTIEILDPVTGDPISDGDPVWQELREVFRAEALLTARAGAVYDRTGDPARQNNPDVLHMEGPFRDDRGNTYLTVDTYQGEPLRDLVERGFVRDREGKVRFNRYLEEILEVLTEAVLRLDALHDAGLWHLDLSPDNIYVVPSAGRTRLTPYLIDYGSAYDRRDPAVKTTHRYTCNPFSPPEIQALAQLQAPDCGYAPNASSDTSAMASILFYAVTGEVFTAGHRLNPIWQEKLRLEYAAGLPAHPGADSFAGSLSDFFDRGLAAAQQDRFTGTGALLEALRSLQNQYRRYGDLLPLVERDELMSYLVLEKHPLYRYRSSDGNVHVLCLGSGVFVRRMILSLISCGQMANARLFIHIASAEPEETLRSYLSQAAPLLEQYSNPKAPAEQEYVTFSYDRVSDILDESVCRELLDKSPQSRYLLISLGSNRSNADAARLYARELARRPNPDGREAILNYYCSEDAANNLHTLTGQEDLPPWLRTEAFGSSLSGCCQDVRALGLRTLKLAHLYNKLRDPRISLTRSARELTRDAYSQRSSCAAALHLGYKLASIGIAPESGPTCIDPYLQALSGPMAGVLQELEHRRWMMYMIADGYRVPTRAQLMQYGFEPVDDGFNDAWKCKARQLHPCLVPCSTDGPRLTGEAWDAFRDPEAIRSSDFDPLDRLSLTLHMLAGKKCRRLLDRGVIRSCFADMADQLNETRLDAREDPDRDESAIPFGELEELLNLVRTEICRETEGLTYRAEQGRLDELLARFTPWGVSISGEIGRLRQALTVFAEYAARRDYKDPDGTINRHLPWLLYAEQDITWIKLPVGTDGDCLTGALILEPHRMVFLGERQPQWDELLRSHGIRGQISYLPRWGGTPDRLTATLKQLAARQRGPCVIDVTGSDERLLLAAHRAADTDRRISLIRCTGDGRVENIRNFPAAAAYTLDAAAHL